MKIIFFGSPEFAIPTLEKLNQKHEILSVVTSHKSAIQKYSENKFKTFIPDNLKDEYFINEIQHLNADIFVVVAFKMLPEIIWKIPPKGTINLHASLLPKYRGASPIHWAIINGETETGLTTFYIDDKIDTGKILLQTTINIKDNETCGELHDRMKILGAELVSQTLDNLHQGIPQTEKPSLAPKIFKNNSEINWNQPRKKVYDFIRGMSPYPGAWTLLNNKIFKIFKCGYGEGKLSFDCSDGKIHVLECQLESKKKMNINDFMLGWKK